ncbi:MAG TPA: MGMT family protein [Candidatus Acidoferrales bacterium]|nr:MGMT family protein [Candidatus Acidoferrales bacterium]
MSWQPVYSLVKKIPRGRVTTYGEIARALRLRGGARAAGHAMAACPSGRGIPWHRVVGAGGRLLIAEPHASLQRRLLETEGVTMTERRVNMKRHAWSPAKPKPRRAGGKPARRRPK